VRATVVVTVFPMLSPCQSVPSQSSTQPGTPASKQPPAPLKKRLFGIVPNYRASPSLTEYQPLSVKEKFKIATQDSFDRGTVMLSAVFAGLGQSTNATPAFGQGAAGYARYLGTSYADFVIGNYMTEAIYPSLLHQDPRYFRRGTGSGWSRLGYALREVVRTHRDSGARQFNYSEVCGNSTAVAISNAYYPGNRTASAAVSRLSIQLGIDAASNALKEFYPDIEHRFKKKHNAKRTP